MSNCEDHRYERPARSSEIDVRPVGHIVVDAEQLFAGFHEVRLMYRNEEYRLRITRNSKLILTK